MKNFIKKLKREENIYIGLYAIVLLFIVYINTFLWITKCETIMKLVFAGVLLIAVLILPNVIKEFREVWLDD